MNPDEHHKDANAEGDEESDAGYRDANNHPEAVKHRFDIVETFQSIVPIGIGIEFVILLPSPQLLNFSRLYLR